MKILGIKSVVIKKFKPYNPKKVRVINKPNLLQQNFFADKPKQKWLSDITYIYTNDCKWTYLAIVLELYSLKVIGYSYKKQMTAELAVEALNNAILTQGTDKGLIVHTDLGSQYISNEFENKLNSFCIEHSYSKKGYPYDNASMESFNSILKKEYMGH